MKTNMKNFSLIKTKSIQTNFPKQKVNSSKESYNVIKQFYGDDIDIFESCFILLLGRSNKTIGYAKISQGGVSGTVVDGKIVFKYAIDTLASAIIIAHNHPSGNLTPSSQDIKLTKNLQEVAKCIDINILDHLILTSEGFYSFSDNGLM